MVRILIVEDSETQALQLQQCIDLGFNGAGYELRVVESTALAIECEAELVPDVILLDLELVGTNANKTIEYIPQLGYRAPVIVITTHNNTELMTKAFKFGADSYMDKLRTTNPERLFSLITNAVNRRTYTPSYLRK